MVIVVFGLPGSGKSFFATRLASKLDATYVSTDELRLKLFLTRTYSDREKLAVYDAMLNIMILAISDEKTIVLDGTFYKESLRNKFEVEANKLGEKLIYFEVTAPEKSIEDRLDKPRVNSEANFDVYLKLKDEYEPLTKDHLVLVSTENIDSMLQKALNYIDAHR